MVIGVIQRYRAHILIIQSACQSAAQPLRLSGQQGLGGWSLQVFGGELPALEQLLLQVTKVLPAEIGANSRGQNPRGDQGHQQQPCLDTDLVH